MASDTDETSTMAEVDVKAEAMVTNPFTDADSLADVLSETGVHAQVRGNKMMVVIYLTTAIIGIPVAIILLLVSCCVKGSAKTGTIISGVVLGCIGLYSFYQAYDIYSQW